MMIMMMMILMFMPHTCRESCGVCGLLSTTNKEEQVVKEKSYTDINKDNFECGHYKLLCENEGDCEDDKVSNEMDDRRSKRQAKEWEEDEFSIFSYNISSKGIFCGSTMISDR